MSSIFISRTPAVKTPAQKKVSGLAIKINTAARKRQMSGPVTVIKMSTDSRSFKTA